MADCVQWVINFPEITILILTGVYKLAGDMLGEIKKHFTLEEGGDKDAKTGKGTLTPKMMQDEETGQWSPNFFQIMFPEHCISPKDGSQFEYQTPAANVSKEPTVRAASIEQALSGMHFGILKLDDVVTNENSLNIDRIQSVNKQISINQAMLDPFGFFDVIGTWYDEKDYYGEKIKQEEQFAKEKDIPHAIQGSVDSGRFNSNVEMKIYLRAAWWPNEAAVKAGKIPAEMTKKDWDLWFDTPKRLNYEFLVKKQKTDPLGFPIKYLNNPRELHKVKFPRELLMRRTIPHTQIPPQGVIVTTVDTAYSTKSWADYTVIMTALIFGGRFHIVNMVRGRFNEYELPKIIAETAHKWKPKRIAIEDSVGVKWMGRELRREMDRLQISVPVEFCTLGLGSKSKSKQLKAKPVLRLLGDERMFFSLACDGLQEIYAELEKFTGTSDDAHDDIVSAISLLVEQFGGYADNDRRINQITSDYVNDQKAKARYDQVFGNGQNPQRLSQSYAEYYGRDDNPVTVFQIDNTLGAVPDHGSSDFDPFGFGG
jgi:phage terminase large subunit-like protein